MNIHPTPKPTPLTTSILIALGVGFGIPALANGGIASLTKPNQGLQCIGTVKHNSKGNSGTNLCPALSATSVRSNNPSPAAFGGNPINLLTGNKFEQLLDIDDLGDAFALRLTRYYNSQSTQRGIFGIGWRSDYELQLQDLGDNVQILTADGSLYHFNKQQIKDDNTGLLNERFVSDDLSLGYVIVKPVSHQTAVNAGSQMIWQWHLPDGRVMEFAPHRQVDKVNTVGRYQYGQLSRVQKLASDKNIQTLYWQLHYNTDGKLARVSNHLGEVLRFEYKADDDGLSYINVSKEKESGRLSGSDKSDNTPNKQVWQYRLDKIGNLLEVITHQGDRLGYEYGDPNDKHNLTAKYHYVQDNDKDSSNDSLKKQLISRFAYDAYDRAILSTGDNDTHKIRVSYDDKATYPTLGDTYTNTLTNSLGQTTQYRYTYDKTGIRLLSAIGVGCMTCNQSNIRYEYNKEGRVITKHILAQANTNPPTPTKFVGNDTNIANEVNILSTERYVYDDFGRVVKTIVQDHIAGSPTHTIDTTYVSDDKNSPAFYLIKSISTDSVFLGKQTGVDYDYDDRGNVIRVKEFGFDGGGKPINIEHHLDYDAHGQPTQVYQLDGLGNRILITKYTWLKVGVLQKIEEPLKNTTTTFYHNEKDLIVKLIRTQDDDELRFDFTYDDKGQASSMARYINGGLAGQVAYERDEFGQIAKVLDGNGQDLGFNALNAGVNQGVLFDAVMMADLKQNTQTGKTPISSAFDKNTLRLTLGDGSQAIYTLDDFGRISAITHPQVGTHRYAYDNQGNLSQIMLFDGRQIVYHYNDKGLRIKKDVYHNTQHNTPQNTNNTTQDKPIVSTTWHYDDKDRLVRITDNAQTVSYVYDNDGNVISKTVELSNLDTPLITKFAYQKDKDGKMQKVSITLPDGTILSSKNNTISYQTPNSTHKTPLLTQSDNVHAGQTSYILGKHITQVRHYDSKDSWAGLSYQSAQDKDKATPLFSQHWQRGNNGLIDAITEKDKQGSHTYHYLYDGTGVLILSNQNSPKTKNATYYAYDTLGNRIARQSKSTVGMMSLTEYHYDDKGRFISTHTGATNTQKKATSPFIQYDSTGKPTSYGKYALHYQNGRLSEVVQQDGKPVANYRYNELGQRTQKISYINDKGERLSVPTTTYYVYEDSLLQHELDDTGNITRHYVYAGDTLIATLDYQTQSTNKDSQNKQGSLWQTLQDKFGSQAKDRQETYASTPKIHYVITDHLGRPRQVLDDNNQLVWQLTPTDFGGVVNKALQDKTGYELNLRFSGQYEDKETGLYYNHHRYYDPSTGRYITPDPLGLAGGDNLYTYVANSPIHYNDPVGLLLFAFDGTKNQDYGTKGFLGIGGSKHTPTNVEIFRDLYKRDPNEPFFPNTTWKYATVDSRWLGLGKPNINLHPQIKPFNAEMQNNNVFYMTGASTTDQYTGIKGVPLFDGGTGSSIVERVDAMVGYLHDYLDTVYQKELRWDKDGKLIKSNKPININLDIVGFSRGAASARMFSSKVEEIMKTGKWYGIDKTILGGKQSAHLDWRYTTKFLQDCGINFKFNFMGLWDTVPAFGLTQDNDMENVNEYKMNLDVSSSQFQTIVHAVATNENRKQFARRSIYVNENQAKSNGVEQSGGKYRLEKGFLGAHSDIGGGYESGDLSNVALMWMIKQAQEKGNIKFKDYSQYNQVNNPIVHDSLWSMLLFSAGGQFRWATDDSKDKSDVSIYNNFTHLSLNWKDTELFQNPNNQKFTAIRNRYADLIAKDKQPAKGIDMTEGGVLMAADDPKKVIQIGDYIDWLNCNYGLNLESNSKYDSSTGYAHPDMDTCFNSAMKYSFSGK